MELLNSRKKTKLMAADELSQYMGITRNAAYTLLHRDDFPSIRIGNLVFAVRDEVDIWITRELVNGGYQNGKEERPR